VKTLIYNSPLALLLGTGTLLGLLTPLGKLAFAAGIDPFLWAALISFIPGIALAIAATKENWGRADLHVFGAISGVFAYVIPNALLFTAIPHIGSGLAGLMYALSPVFTAALSFAFNIRPPSRGLLVAVALGFVGAVLIVLGRNGLAAPKAPQWLLLSLLVPVSLAIGNVYRTAKWPKDAPPTQVGAASNLLAVIPLLLLSAWNGGLQATTILEHWQLSVGQWFASLAMLTLFFRLQWVGGPTYLSQIGYVAAALSLAIGTLILGESYPPLVWAGAVFILAGIVSTAFDKSAAKTA
jgi:drug/metabolite transporter (DMT)-like permease